MRIINHSKQRSDETEFEFPPPPTDQDIAQIMNDPVQGIYPKVNLYLFQEPLHDVSLK